MSDNFVSWEEAVLWLISQPDKKDLVRDCYFDASVFDAAHRYHKSEEWKEIHTLLSSSETGKVLDVGAGRGVSSYALSKEGWNVVAIEPDKSDLVGAGAIMSLAKEEALPIKVIEEFGENINEEASSFDLVFARQVMHHANDLNQFCTELHRLLKPGGKLITVRDHVISKESDLPLFLDLHPLHNLYGGEHAYTEQQYKGALRQAGFEVSKVLKPFDSVINYSPKNKEMLKIDIQMRIKKISGLGALSRLLDNEVIFDSVLSLLSLIDNRPGRLYSFICTKIN
jgi:2-polyprenyl-3-methyl-5-hydroxy-6-metoxy-1,4-benzoquinol methylase